jgi:hypothetical protein
LKRQADVEAIGSERAQLDSRRVCHDTAYFERGDE